MLFWFNDFNSYIIWWGYFEDSKQKHLPSRSPLDDEIDPDSWIIDEVNILRFRPSLDRYSLKLKQPVQNSSAQECIKSFFLQISRTSTPSKTTVDYFQKKSSVHVIALCKIYLWKVALTFFSHFHGSLQLCNKYIWFFGIRGCQKKGPKSLPWISM